MKEIILIFCLMLISGGVFAEVKEEKIQSLRRDNVSLFQDIVSKEKEISLLKKKLEVLRKINEQCKESHKEEVAGVKNKRIESNKDLLSKKLRAHYNLGFIYAQKKELDKAIQEYKQALTIEPREKDAHFNLGFLYALKEDFVNAVKEYEEVLSIDSHDKEAYYNLAIIYHQNLKDEEKTRQYYQRFLEELER